MALLDNQFPARELSYVDVDDAMNHRLTSGKVVTDYNDSGDEFEPSHGGRKTMRAAAVVVAVVGFVAVATCSAMFRESSQANDSLDGFMNKLAVQSHAPVASWIKPKPDLCNLGIVVDFCLRANAKGPGHLDGNPNSPKASVSAATLSDLLSVSVSSVTAFLKRLGAVNLGAGNYPVSCAQLCQKTVSSFGPGELPGMVDVGCWYKQGQAPSNNPCMPTADSIMMPVCDVDVSMPVLAKTEIPAGSKYEAWEAVGTPRALPDASFDQLKLAVVRLFRIFPGSKTAVSVINATTRVEFQRKLAEPLSSLTNECFYSKDDVCDEPKFCLRDTDCSDCGSCKSQVPGLNTQKPVPGRYGDELLQSGMKAQSILAWALMALQAGKGPYAAKERASLKKKIATASALLDDITYNYPAKSTALCKEKTGAYMDGNTMHLCDSFFERPLTGIYLGILKTIMGDAVYPIANFVTTNL
mmetsp:Transcript_131020/g.231562  ORF Transcript_131020/g.231562 Transcript_131020/m.231562 type:complete len:469 (-) Transcript_131020:8-1414(-)